MNDYRSNWIDHNYYLKWVSNGPPLRYAKVGRPLIVCLCGSTRFKQEFIAANFRETMAGKIVLSVGLYGHADKEVYNPTEEEKVKLDELHKRKIDLADEVLIICPRVAVCDKCGKPTKHELYGPSGCCQFTFRLRPYIGESTRSELEYAKKVNKVIRFLEEPEA